MSLGYGGHAHLVVEDDKILLYSYCSYNINLENSETSRNREDGEIQIQRAALVEPEIHEKLKRTPSGRKKLFTKRVKRDVPFETLFALGQITVRNAYGTWAVDSQGIDRGANNILKLIFDQYQETGEIPREVAWYQ